MVEAKVARGTFSINLCGIRFFWMDTMGLDWRIFDLAKPRYDKKLPVVLSRGEVWRILDEVTIDVYRVCLTTIYSCGLRLLEGATLSIPQIDSDRMQLHIHGKDGSDRYVPLPEGALLMLREFWKTHRSPILLFPAPTRKGLKHSLATDAGPVHRSSVQGAFRRARDKAGIAKDRKSSTERGTGAWHPLPSHSRSESSSPPTRPIPGRRRRASEQSPRPRTPPRRSPLTVLQERNGFGVRIPVVSAVKR
jgi:site-specific recombinase XerD